MDIIKPMSAYNVPFHFIAGVVNVESEQLCEQHVFAFKRSPPELQAVFCFTQMDQQSNLEPMLYTAPVTVGIIPVGACVENGRHIQGIRTQRPRVKQLPYTL